jgi:hypothetical protein
MIAECPLPPKADIQLRRNIGRYGPIADMTARTSNRPKMPLPGIPGAAFKSEGRTVRSESTATPNQPKEETNC